MDLLKGGLVNTLVDSGAFRYYFDDAFIPGLRYKLANYQLLKSPPPWGTTSMGLLTDY